MHKKKQQKQSQFFSYIDVDNRERARATNFVRRIKLKLYCGGKKMRNAGGRQGEMWQRKVK